MDFLGLKTLTVIEDTLALIHQRESNFLLKEIPLDDAAAFALYNRGETIGLFQMESGGMTSLSKQFDVKKLDDIIRTHRAFTGQADGTHSRYVKAKKGLRRSNICIPLLEDICADTYGVMIYQETGDGSGEQTCRLLTRPSRSSPARHGQERQGEDGQREKKFHRRLCARKQDS